MELNQAPNEHKTLKLTPYKGKSWKDMSRTEKVVSIIALVFIGLVIFGIIGTAINSNTNYSTTTPGKNSNATPIPENSNQTTQSQPSQPQKPPSTLDMLWQALDNSGQSRDGVSISFTSASDMAPGYGSLVTFKKNYGEIWWPTLSRHKNQLK